MCKQFTCDYVGSTSCYDNDGSIFFYQDCFNCSRFTGKCSECLFYDPDLNFCILHERSVKNE